MRPGVALRDALAKGMKRRELNPDKCIVYRAQQRYEYDITLHVIFTDIFNLVKSQVSLLVEQKSCHLLFYVGEELEF